MKTKARTIIGIVVLGIIGFTNINAINGNKSEIEMNVALEKEEHLTIEPWMLEDEFWVPTQKNDTVVVEKNLEIEAWMLDGNLWE